MNHNNTTHKNKHVQREVKLYSPEISMMERGTNQQYVEILPIPIQNDDPINAQIGNTENV